MNKYCVYLHIDKENNVRYVGSGNTERPYSLSNRSKEHRKLISELRVEIVKENLSKIDAINLETELYNLYLPHGYLLNKIPPNTVNAIDYDVISKYVEYNEHSASKLIWKEPGKFNSRYKGQSAGSLDAAKGYYKVKILGKKYYVHRIIWVLFTKQDIQADMVVDHIDRDRSNNLISNLRVVSQSENRLNSNPTIDRKDNGRRRYRKNIRNKSGVTGVYWCKFENIWKVEIYIQSIMYRKRFNPRKLFPDLNTESAIKAAFNDAVNFVKSLYS